MSALNIAQDFASMATRLDSAGARAFAASFVVMTITWTLLWVLRKASAALRHRVLCLGLTAVVLLPATMLLTDAISPTIRVVAQTPTPSPERSPEAWQPVVVSREVAGPMEHSLYDDAYTDETAFGSGVPTSARTAEVDSAAPVLASQDQSDPPLAAAHPAQASRWAGVRSPVAMSPWMTVWCFVSLTLLVRAGLDRHRLRRIVRQSVNVTDDRARSILQAIGAERHVRQPELLCTECVKVPVAVGIFRPRILLPVGFGKWSDDRIRVVLLHELTHIGRADVLTQSIARVGCMLFWFNPLVWLAAGRMRFERELACDDSVLQSGEDPVDYADHLLDIATAICHRYRVPTSASAMATPNHLASRVRRMMDADVDRTQLSRRWSNSLACCAVVITIGLAIATPSIALTPEEPGIETAAVFEANASGTELTISGDLSDDWFDRVKSMPGLRKLTIERPGPETDFSRLGKLKTLKSLHAKDFPLGGPLADGLLLQAAKIPNLKNATFEGTGLTSSGLRPISQSPLEELSLIEEELLTDSAFEPIGKMKSLRSLELIATPIEAPGLKRLQSCLQLTSLKLIKDRGATKRIQAIAEFPRLEELSLSDTAYSDLVVLKECKSLRQLTLHRCGAFKTSESLSQLTQLKRILLDNPDIRGESLADVRDRLAVIGIEVLDVTKMPDVSVPGERSTEVNEATALARKVHQEMDIAKNHPTYWARWKATGRVVPSMKRERIRTLHLLKEALVRESVPRAGGFDSNDQILAWSPDQLFCVRRYFKEGELQHEAYKYGDPHLAWARETYQNGGDLRHFPRNGIKDFADTLFVTPIQLKVSHQSYWWGKGLHHRVATSSVSPDTATYVELPSESFDGEPCRVLESAGRSERLWVSTQTGRLRGVLTYIHQGFSTPFYRQPVVAKIIGKQVASREEYRALMADGPGGLSIKQRSQLGQAWSEYTFESAIPGSLHVLSDYREIAPQRWYPFNVRSSGWHHNDQNEQYYEFYNQELNVSEVSTDRVDLRSVWAPLLPKPGEKIQDQRFATAVDYEYREDRTEAEIAKLVSEQLFKFAKTQLLFEKRRSPLNEMSGKPAPKMPLTGWIGERPELKGKSYLLHFWATWCGPCKNDVPLLNRLAKNRLVIGVHPAGTPEEEVRKRIADAEMDYPTIMATAESKKLIGYPVTMYPYCVQVDEQGKVAKHGFLNDVLGSAPQGISEIRVKTDPTLVGQVLATDAADGFVQLSLGTEHGLEKNQVLQIVRGGRAIGQVRVVLVRETQSVGKLQRDRDAPNVKEGDVAQSI